MAAIYVAKDGNDANNGSTLALAKRTLEAAHTAAVDGDAILLATPGGEWREDFTTGALDFGKAAMTIGLDIIGIDVNNPPIISGLTGTVSVRITTSLYRFKNVIIDSSASTNTIVVQITSASAITAAFERCKLICTHDIYNGAAYIVSMSGAGAHNLFMEDCEMLSYSPWMNGLYLAGGGIHRLIRSKFNLSRFNNGVNGMRIDNGVVSLTINECEFDGYYGILQSGAQTLDATYRITDSIINGRHYAFLTNGAAATKRLNIFVRDTKFYSDNIGFVVAGNLTTVGIHNSESRAANVAFGFPADGAYSGCRSNITDCHTTTYASGGHALLIGDGSERCYIDKHHSNGQFGSWSAVIKGSNGLIENSRFDGGTAQTILFKGTTGCEMTGCRIVQNAGGVAVDIRNGDPTPIASGVVFRGNVVEVTNGSLFSIGALSTQEDGTSVFNDNEYHVVYDGTWGTVRGTACSSLQNVRDAWTGVVTNDDDSYERQYSKRAEIRAAIGMAAADLDTQLDAIASGADGDFGLTITVVDALSSDPIAGARVTLLTSLGASTSASKVTGVLGEVIIRADAGDYKISVRPPSGYDVPDLVDITVSGDVIVAPIELTATLVPASANPALCTVAFDLLNQYGQPESEARVYAHLNGTSQIAADHAIVDVSDAVLTDVNGRALMTLIRSTEFDLGEGRYTIEVKTLEGKKFKMFYTVPDADSDVATIVV